MSCALMLDLMLEADPAELAGQGDSVLAAHLRECGRCDAIARQILADTWLLGSALSADVRRRPRALERAARAASITRRLGIAAVAAATAGIAVLRGVEDLADHRSPPRVVRTAAVESAEPTSSQTRRASRVTTSKRIPPTRAASTRPARRAAATPIAPVPFPRAAAVEPARFAFANAEDEVPVRAADIASADAGPGKRVAVLRTSDPTVTVYWLY